MLRIGIDVTPLAVREGRHGIGSYLRGLLSGLTARDSEHEFVLFAGGGAGIDRGLPRDRDRFRVVTLATPRLGRGSALLSHQIVLPAAARRLGLDLLHIPGVSVNASMPSIPLWSPVPLVVTVHDLNPLRFPGEILPRARHRIFYRTMLRAVRRAEHLLCDSRATRDDLVSELGVADARITVAALAADPIFTPARAAPGDARAAALENDDYVLHVGGPGHTKNLARLLRAMVALWSEKALPVDIVCVSSLPCDPLALCPDAAAYRDRIRVLLDVDRPFLVWLYQRARCLAFPSLHEGFGLPVLEAMASGCPVITSRVASLPEVGGDAALYVEPRDVSAIRDALARILGDPALRETAAAAGLRQAARFSYASTAAAVLEVYDRVGRRR